jgi:hypothetical protein
VLGGGDVVEDLSEARVVGLIVGGGEHLTQRGVRALQCRGALRFAKQRGAAKQLGVGELSRSAVQRAEGRPRVHDQEIRFATKGRDISSPLENQYQEGPEKLVPAFGRCDMAAPNAAHSGPSPAVAIVLHLHT